MCRCWTSIEDINQPEVNSPGNNRASVDDVTSHAILSLPLTVNPLTHHKHLGAPLVQRQLSFVKHLLNIT
ncbi:hypothetical protein J6590_045746 [Homalodisca vitripennis]|nr:hypothetical protein J6590_045746 [Homalodisca vitripennis]